MMLAKTTRVARLFDFYGELLTEKQKLLVELYFHHDLSLGEIAEQLDVSRQAIHDALKRTEVVLEGYESKLALITRYQQVSVHIDELLKLWDGAQIRGQDKDQGIVMLREIKEMLIP